MELSKEIQKFHKKKRSIEYALNLKKNLELGRPNKRKAPRVRTGVLRRKMPDGSTTEARSEAEKAKLLADYFGELFGDPRAARHIPGWIYDTFCEADLANFRCIDFAKEILISMGKGKSCADEDLIVVEMLLLPEEAFDVIVTLYKDRRIHWNAKDDTRVWAFHSVCLIAKCTGLQFVIQI